MPNQKPDICKGCPAYAEPGIVGSSKASGRPKLIIVGEAPGPDEISSLKQTPGGMPFIGAAGSLLWKSAREVGLYRGDCHVMNSARCLTKSTAAFFHCWKSFGQQELDSLPKDIPILILGGVAKDILLPQWASMGPTTTRGCRKGRMLSALHPAFIRRTARGGDSEKQDLQPTLAYDISTALGLGPEPNPVTYGVVVSPSVATFRSCDLETNMTLNPRLAHAQIDQIGWGYPDGSVQREKYDEGHRPLYQQQFKGCPIVFHNSAFDVDWLETKGYERFEVEDFEDTMGAAHLLHSDLPLGLEFVNSLYVHVPPWWQKSTRNRFQDGTYHATDLYVTAQAWPRMKLEMQAEGLYGLYTKEWKPVTRVCIDLKQKGIKMDTERTAKLQIAFQLQIQKIDTALAKLAPGVNWNSSTQVMDTLYKTWGLPEQRNENNKLTGDAEALETLTDITNHPGPKLLVARRTYGRMISVYTDNEVDSNGFFHFDVSFTTSTGRARGFILTIPRGAMRSIFIPDEPDWEIAYADWSSVELWISAVRSGDKAMQQVLRDHNFHEWLGTQAFAKPILKGTEAYEDTKHIDHGYNYGRGAPSISKGHDIPINRVVPVLQMMDTKFAIWHKWREDILSEARRTGKLTNAFGFTRYMWSGNIKGMAWSFDPQADVAHMCKRVMIQLHLNKQLPAPARLLMPFHDAVAVTYPKEMRAQVTKVLDDVMGQPWPELGGWRAPYKIGYGDNLADACK